MIYGSLFAGIGGFDLGFNRAGMQCAWQVEIDPKCQAILRRNLPGAEIFSDVREVGRHNLAAIDVICGGDPCPIRSRARSNGASKHPDLSGYFLAVVGGLRPGWVVRENVPASDDVWFDAALGYLGYGTVIIRMDAAKITGQSRQRDFIVGRYQATRQELRGIFSDCAYGSGTYTTQLGTRQVTPALTTHRTRYDSRDCYIYETGRLRILDGDERERLAGFPEGWTAGFSEAARARQLGNAVAVPCAEWIARRIVEHD